MLIRVKYLHFVMIESNTSGLVVWYPFPTCISSSSQFNAVLTGVNDSIYSPFFERILCSVISRVLTRTKLSIFTRVYSDILSFQLCLRSKLRGFPLILSIIRFQISLGYGHLQQQNFSLCGSLSSSYLSRKIFLLFSSWFWEENNVVP